MSRVEAQKHPRQIDPKAKEKWSLLTGPGNVDWCLVYLPDGPQGKTEEREYLPGAHQKPTLKFLRQDGNPYGDDVFVSWDDQTQKLHQDMGFPSGRGTSRPLTR